MIKVVEKPWGEEQWLACTDKYAGKLLIIKKGHRLSLQYHQVKHETQYVDQGKIKLALGKDKDNLQEQVVEKGQVIEIPPGTLHRLEALEDTRIIEVSTPELDDVVRLDDDYGRGHD